MKTNTSFRLLVLLLACTLYSDDGLAQSEPQIDSIFARFTDGPGCAVGVFSKGEIIFEKGYGYANLEHRVPITPQTSFDIGSNAKQFTAACIALLAEQGALSLDEPVRKYIPELPVYEKGDPTIRQLIHHTSGLRDYMTPMILGDYSPYHMITERFLLEMIASQSTLDFIPQEEYSYCNAGYILLAVIIRRVSGMSNGEFAAKHIFEPLGMTHTLYLENTHTMISNRATAYSQAETAYERDHPAHFSVGGDGQVQTTIRDMARWDKNFLSTRIGGEEFINTLLTRGVLNNGDTIDYAFGLIISERNGHRIVYHTGGFGGFRSYYVQFPESQLSFVVLNNGHHFPRAELHALADLYVPARNKPRTQAPDESAPDKLPLHLLEKYVGTYQYDSTPEDRVTIEIEHGVLVKTHTRSDEKLRLMPVDNSAFTDEREQARYWFANELDGKTIQLQEVTPDWNFNYLTRMPAYSMGSDEAIAYQGTYYCPALHSRCMISWQNGAPHAQLNFGEKKKLVVYTRDQWLMEHFLLSFSRDEQSEVIGLHISEGSTLYGSYLRVDR